MVRAEGGQGQDIPSLYYYEETGDRLTVETRIFIINSQLILRTKQPTQYSSHTDCHGQAERSTNLRECYDERDKCNVINQLASQGHIIQAIGYSNESMICDIYSITQDCDPSLSSFVIVSL